MNEFKLGEELEKQQIKEEQKAVNLAVEEEAGTALKDDGKSLLWIILIISGIFVVFIGGVKVYDHFTSATVVSIDDFLQKNLEEEGLGEGEGYVYNGFSIVKVDGLWWTDLNRHSEIIRIPLHFSPKEVETVPISGTLNEVDFNKETNLYLAINPLVRDKYYTLALSELTFNIAKGIDRTPIGSCTEENFACENRTIVSCADTQGKAVIELELAEQTSIEYSGSCIKLSGNGYELTKAVDKILYMWYGIMK
jgi:hypothetical protein